MNKLLTSFSLPAEVIDRLRAVSRAGVHALYFKAFSRARFGPGEKTTNAPP
ncbi:MULTISPECIES: hypothetical protein [Cupriavidus]|uniref:hypothetical protein n=1 Tax=Cupriavidus sp. DF5525 TaxID=3160989 RepID=UPI0032DE8139